MHPLLIRATLQKPPTVARTGDVDASTVKGSYVVVGFSLAMAALSVVLMHAK